MANQVLEPRLPRKAHTVAPGDTCRMFESDFLERFSRIHPATPFVVWIPVVVFVLTRSALRHDLGAASTGGFVLLGVLCWTLTEYVLHKYVFHWTNDSPLGKRIHFLIHGVHHDYPNDKDRLVMPLLVSVPLGVMFYLAFTLACGLAAGEPLFAGMVVGYLFYDGTHYYVHHFVPTTGWGKFLRRHHLTHHFADHDGGFGVSSPLWDLAFRTMPVKKAK